MTAGKQVTQAQKNRFNPKCQKTRKWKIAANKHMIWAETGPVKATGKAHSQRIKAHAPKRANQGCLNRLRAGKGP